MQDIGKKIKEAMERKKARTGKRYTQDMLSSDSGISQGEISQIINGKRTPTTETLKLLLKYLDLTFAEVLDNFSENNEKYHSFDIMPHGGRVPIISWVIAGAWMDIQDNFYPGEADEWLDLTFPVSSHSFALCVKGFSMEPEFVAGDIIVVDPDVIPVTGSFVVAKTFSGENGEATLKQFVQDGEHIYLRPLNKEFKTLDMTGKDFVIIGCVVSKTKRYPYNGTKRV